MPKHTLAKKLNALIPNFCSSLVFDNNSFAWLSMQSGESVKNIKLWIRRKRKNEKWRTKKLTLAALNNGDSERKTMTREQRRYLNECFAVFHRPTLQQKEDIVRNTGLQGSVIYAWFRRKRYRYARSFAAETMGE